MARINVNDPVNWDAPLNRDRVWWDYPIPGKCGGGQIWNLAAREAFGSSATNALRNTYKGKYNYDHIAASSMITIGTRGKYDNTGEVSVGLWISNNINHTATVYILAVRASTTTHHYSIGYGPFGNNQMVFVHNGGWQAALTNALPTNAWRRVIWVRRGTPAQWSIEGYVNGALATNPFTPSGAVSGSNCFFEWGYFGDPLWTGYCDAKMHDRVVWNRALSPAEIAYDYRASLGGYKDELNWINTLTPVASAGISDAFSTHSPATARRNRFTTMGTTFR